MSIITMPDHNQSMTAVAFNEGADARWACVPLDENPYNVGTESHEWNGWRWGWLEVHFHYGDWVYRMSRPYPTRRLPFMPDPVSVEQPK